MSLGIIHAVLEIKRRKEKKRMANIPYQTHQALGCDCCVVGMGGCVPGVLLRYRGYTQQAVLRAPGTLIKYRYRHDTHPDMLERYLRVPAEQRLARGGMPHCKHDYYQTGNPLRKLGSPY